VCLNLTTQIAFITVELEGQSHTLLVDKHSHALLLLARTERTLLRTLLSIIHEDRELLKLSITGE